MISEAHNIDVLEYLKTVEDKKFDLAICDPPYGIGEDGRKNHTRGKLAKSNDYREAGEYDNESPNEDFFKEIIRVSKNQIFFGANHYISKLPYDSSCWIVWDKMNGETDFADCEIAWTSFKTAVRMFSYRWQGMLQGDMLAKEKIIHPNHKPTALYDWILKKYAKKGDFIFDPMMGSQSSRVACYNLDFNFIGCEMNKVHFKTGCERYEKHVHKYSLFKPSLEEHNEILNEGFTLD